MTNTDAKNKVMQKKLYAVKMKEAAADADYVKRTMDMQKEFDKSDADTDKLIEVEDLNKA